MPQIDLDNEFLELFFNITNKSVPNEVTLVNLKSQLIDIVDVLNDLNKNSKRPYKSQALEEPAEELTSDAILVVDDLGVITYQLKVLLSKFKMDVDCSQEIYDAVSKFKKRKYKYVVMDLFIPTEREGLILLTELKKMASTMNHQVTIGVITASPRKEVEIQCKQHGADFFLEKNNNWQAELFNKMDAYVKADNPPEDDF